MHIVVTAAVSTAGRVGRTKDESVDGRREGVRVAERELLRPANPPPRCRPSSVSSSVTALLVSSVDGRYPGTVPIG